MADFTDKIDEMFNGSKNQQRIVTEYLLYSQHTEFKSLNDFKDFIEIYFKYSNRIYTLHSYVRSWIKTGRKQFNDIEVDKILNVKFNTLKRKSLNKKLKKLKNI